MARVLSARHHDLKTLSAPGALASGSIRILGTTFLGIPLVLALEPECRILMLVNVAFWGPVAIPSREGRWQPKVSDVLQVPRSLLGSLLRSNPRSEGFTTAQLKGS